MLRFRYKRKKKRGCFEATLYDDLVYIGSIGACRTYLPHSNQEVLMVMHIDVRMSHRRRGFGTMLYREMRDIACNNNLPLSSSPAILRSKMSTGFWQKQLALGRARTFGDARYYHDQVIVLLDPCGLL